MRVMVAAFGDAGHAFPAISLARALAGRGHEVVVESWERWREPVEELGLEFAAAEQYTVFPPPAAGSGDVSAAAAARTLLPFLEEWKPDAVVSDILTLAPALAAESGRGAVGDVDPAPLSRDARRDAVLRQRGEGSAYGGWAGALECLGAAAQDGPAAGAGGAQRAARGDRAGADRAVSRRDQREAGAGRDVPAARVPASVASEAFSSPGRWTSRCRIPTSSCRPGTRRWCWWRRARRRIWMRGW